MATSPNGSVDVKARAFNLLRRPVILVPLVLVIAFWIMARHIEANRLEYENSPEGHAAAARAVEQAEIESAQRLVAIQLRDSSSAAFLGGEIVVRRGQKGVCGFVNSKNGFGGMSGDQSYAVIGPRVLIADQGPVARGDINSFCYG